jgi:hypothetical protein
MSEQNTATVTVQADAFAGMDDDSVALALRPKLGQFNDWDVTRKGDAITVKFSSVSRGDSRPA